MPTLLAQFKESQLEKERLTKITQKIETAINEKPIFNILTNALQLQHTGYTQSNNYLITLEPQKSTQFSGIDSFLFRIKTNEDNILFKAYLTLNDTLDLHTNE